MKQVKVLGGGCANCATTVRLVEEVARETGVAIELVKVEEIAEIMSYGVMSTPAVVVDGTLVHAGGVPGKETIMRWFDPSAD